MTLDDVLASYTDKVAPRAARPHLRWAIKTPANDTRCAGCGATHCGCPDAVWSGAVPPGAA